MLAYSSYTADNKADFTLSRRDMQINFNLDANKERFNNARRILKSGECEGAVVISVYPLFIAAYAKEMDAVVLLDFSHKKLEALNRGLSVKSKLLTVNGYERDSNLSKKGKIQKDLIPTKNTSYQWQKVYPIIADFTVEEKDKLEQIKNGFEPEYWDYIYELGSAYYKYGKVSSRLGSPDSSDMPIFGIDINEYNKKTYGDDGQEHMPAKTQKKMSPGLVVLIAVIGITGYLLLRNFAGDDAAKIFQTIFKIIF